MAKLLSVHTFTCVLCKNEYITDFYGSFQFDLSRKPGTVAIDVTEHTDKLHFRYYNVAVTDYFKKQLKLIGDNLQNTDQGIVA